MVCCSASPRTLCVHDRAALVQPRIKPQTAWLRADFDFDLAQRDVPKEEQLEIDESWLVGVWDEMQLDPRTWGVVIGLATQIDLLNLHVRHTRRLVAHQHALARLNAPSGHVRGYAEHGAAWPASWSVLDPVPNVPEDAHLPLCGIDGLDELWRRSAAAPAGPSLLEADAIDWEPGWLNLRQPPMQRPSPAIRAAAREQELTAGPPFWRGFDVVWKRLRDPTIHRPFRIT